VIKTLTSALSLVLALAAIWQTGGPALSADSSIPCEAAHDSPAGLIAQCRFLASADVQPNGTLSVTATSAGSGITTLGAQGCTPAGIILSASGSLSMMCPEGLSAGQPVLVTAKVSSFTFNLPYGVTYNAGSPSPTTETLTFSSTLPAATVTYKAGWNLVGGSAGTVLTGAAGSLYTLKAGDSSYEALPASTPLQAGVGYWAYFPAPTTVTQAPGVPQDLMIPLPAGQWIMVGNPTPSSVTVNVTPEAGALEYRYNTTSAAYETSPLSPGEGAWVYSARGGSVRIQALAVP
jgi:hypothetical protein